MRTIIEPFRIKMTEPLKITTSAERVDALEAAHHNVFLIDAEDCCIDLLTDSGTGAMSAQQWAAMMIGDESYAGSRSWKHFEGTVREITGMEHILPTHQGRAAEGILAECVLKPGDIIPNNSHFDTTRANIEYRGAIALNLPCREAFETQAPAPFKGNMDVAKLEACIAEHGREKIPFAMVTVTNNTGGGQPVSMENLRAVKEILKRHDIPLVIDACRFAENAYFVREREEGYRDRPLLEIAQEMFSLADGATMSCKKDGLANIGGFLVCQNDEWADRFRNLLILREGFPTYGGLAGRDLEAIAVGLKEALDYDYQVYRHATVEYMVERLTALGIPMVLPAGGHAVFLDAKRHAPGNAESPVPGDRRRQRPLPGRRRSRRRARQRHVRTLRRRRHRAAVAPRAGPPRLPPQGLHPEPLRLPRRGHRRGLERPGNDPRPPHHPSIRSPAALHLPLRADRRLIHRRFLAMLTLIRNAKVIAPENLGEHDILVAGERIEGFAEPGGFSIKGIEVDEIDASGLFVLPGNGGLARSPARWGRRRWARHPCARDEG